MYIYYSLPTLFEKCTIHSLSCSSHVLWKLSPLLSCPLSLVVWGKPLVNLFWTSIERATDDIQTDPPQPKASFAKQSLTHVERAPDSSSLKKLPQLESHLRKLPQVTVFLPQMAPYVALSCVLFDVCLTETPVKWALTFGAVETNSF